MNRHGKSLQVLVLEDEYFIADELARALEASGVSVLGPFANEQDAIAALESERVDFAVIDVNLGSGPSFDLALELGAQHIPFIFLTGYEQVVIPPLFTDRTVFVKPVKLGQIVGLALASADADPIRQADPLTI